MKSVKGCEIIGNLLKNQMRLQVDFGLILLA